MMRRLFPVLIASAACWVALADEASPPVGTAVLTSDVGYYNRLGGHSVELSDWIQFIEFARMHLK